MAAEDFFAAYFSHSWSNDDVLINLWLWEQLSTRCLLLIDKPEATKAEGDRPYFISRIESLIRRSDLFVACLPQVREDKQKPKELHARGDSRFNRCSPYILFELRLAERADIPRFILYDLETGFGPHSPSSPRAHYVGRRFGELKEKIAQGVIDQPLVDELDQWLSWVSRNCVPEPEGAYGRVACLLGNDKKGEYLRRVSSEAVVAAGFDQPLVIDAIFHTDAELCLGMREIDLLLVDVGNRDLLPVYHVAHALLVPTIRIHSAVTTASDVVETDLPDLLRGHPQGYQKDLTAPDPEDVLFQRIRDRTMGTMRGAKAVIGFEHGRSLLYERTYPSPHFVFISHDQKLNDRALVQEIVAECKRHGVLIWEYATENRSGEDWREKMFAALEKTTHMIALLSPDYEQSPGCKDEWSFAIEHREKVTLLPFLIKGRTRPSVDLRAEEIAHQSLTRSSVLDARDVVDRLRVYLLKPSRSPQSKASTNGITSVK